MSRRDPHLGSLAGHHALPVLVMLAGLAAATTPALAADGAVSLRYELNAAQIDVGDSFQLDVVLTARSEEPVEELSLPDLPAGLTVLQERRAQSQQVSFAGGRRQVVIEQRYMYFVRGDEPGAYRIPEATARLGRAVARAAPVVVRVVDASAPAAVPPEGAGPVPGARFGRTPPTAFLEVTVDRTSAWVGQQVTATTEVYTQQPLAQWPRLPALKPPGFFCASLLDENRPQPSQRTIAGRSYYVYLVNKDALFPLAAGPASIPSQALTIVPAGSLFSRTRELPVRSAALTVEVKALPEEGRPTGFSPGNVGHWQLQASVRPARGTLGQPLTLTLAATGTGSLEQLELPTWSGGDQARVFPATTRRDARDVSAADPELGGRVVVELLVQPQQEGQLRIPPFTLVTFDPDQGVYKESVTAALVVPVSGGKAAAASAPHQGGRQVIAKGARPLKRGVIDEEPPGEGPVLTAAGLFVLGLVGLGAGALRRRRGTSAAGRRATLRRDRQKALDDATARGDLAALERVLLDALAERCGGAVKAASSGELLALLVDRGIEATLADEVVAFIRDVEAARYMGGGGAPERTALANRAAALVARVEAA